MNHNQELAVAQMRRAVHKLGASTEGYGDITLMRFLVARSLDTDKATKMFVQWKDWRTSFVPLNYIPESQVPDELQHKKMYLQSLSTNGHPVVIVKVHNHTPNKDQLQFKRFVVHVLDKTIASSFRPKEIGNEKLVAILDLQKLAYKNIDVRGLINGFQFLQDYYPERLAKCYLLKLGYWCVEQYDPISRCLTMPNGDRLHITAEDIHLTLGLTLGGEVLKRKTHYSHNEAIDCM